MTEYRGATHSICISKFSVPKKIPIVFHNGSNNDYYFAMEDSAEEFEKPFTCLGKNTKKYITFKVPIQKKVTRVDKNGEEITKKSFIYYSLLIVQDLWQIHYQILSIIFPKVFRELNVNVDTMMKNEKCETYGIKHKYCNRLLEYRNFKDVLTEYKCLRCNTNYQHKSDEMLKQRFFNTYEISNHDNKFILLLRKYVYTYKYMDDW